MQIGTAVFDGSNTASGGGGGGGPDISTVLVDWQIQTCGDAPVNVGPPTQALRVVAINKLQASICNPKDIIGRWNTPGRDALAATENKVYAAGSVHSLAFKVISGDGTIKIGAAAAQAIVAGEADSWTASELLDSDFEFVCNAGKIVITTQGPAPAV